MMLKRKRSKYAHLVELAQLIVHTAESRKNLIAPEDPEVLALCKRIGFGAVMDSAARQWRKDLLSRGHPDGAHAIAVNVFAWKKALVAVTARLGRTEP